MRLTCIAKNSIYFKDKINTEPKLECNPSMSYECKKKKKKKIKKKKKKKKKNYIKNT